MELGKRLVESAEDVAEENVETYGGISASVYSILQTLLTPATLAENMADKLSGKDINLYSPLNTGITLGEAERDEVSKKIENTHGAVLSTTYDILMNVADELALLPLKKIGGKNVALAFLATEKASSAIINAKQSGLSDEQAITYGIICGGAEIAFDKIPPDQLFGVKNADSLEPLVKKTLVKSGIKTSRSICSSISTIVLSKEKRNVIQNGNLKQTAVFIL